MTKRNKEKVYESYDEIVHWFDDARQILYHESLSTKEYEKLLNESSFKVLLHKIRDPQYRTEK